MAKKSTSRSRYSSAADDAGKALSDSAQKIWLAGLGAYERAKAEGPRMFDTLVEQGRSLGGKAREAADQALKSVREGASGASGRFDKLEQVFEERVAKSLGRLGVLTRGEVSDLSRQVRDLTDDVRSLMARAKGQGAAAKRGKKSGAAKKKMKRSTRGSRARRA